MKNTLLKIGLSEKEIEIYLHVLEKGGLPTSNIAKALDHSESSVRYMCKSLTEKGMLLKDGVYFSAASPERAVSKLESWHSQAKNELLIYQINKQKSPQITVICNRAESLEMYGRFWDMVPRGATVYGHVSLLSAELYDFTDDIWKKCVEKRKERNIFFNILCENSELAPKLKASDYGNNRKTIIIKPSNPPLGSFETIACDDVAFDFVQQGNEFLAVLTTSKSLARAKKKQLSMIWSQHSTTDTPLVHLRMESGK